MEGLVKEAKAHAIDAEIEDEDVRDASIISQYQRMTHYALAGYGTVLAFARRLGFKDDAEQLQTCLDNTYSGDREMSQLAEGEVNREAGWLNCNSGWPPRGGSPVWHCQAGFAVRTIPPRRVR